MAFGMIISGVIPLCISPVLSYAFMRLLEQLESAERELHEALSKVMTLSGMLPICASCKKIRDDQGYWKQLEEYISTHSEATFSHGICPDCTQKLYPDYVASQKK